MPKSRKVLFDSQWLRVVELNGWFHASEPSISKDNKAVAVLPYRKNKNSIQFLSRFELNPAHMTDLIHQVSVITGACETGNPRYHAKMELLEEGGYNIPEERFKFLGVVNPMKASCTQLYLYIIRIYQKDKREEAKGDGGEHESKEYADWVDRQTMINCKDPYAHTMILRGNL